MSEIERAANPTTEEAIKYLEGMIFTQDFHPSTLRAKAVNTMAIEALREKQARESQPSTDIVHCKDCKHLGIKDFIYGYCKRDMSGQVQPNDYCSRGERKKRQNDEKRGRLARCATSSTSKRSRRLSVEDKGGTDKQ